MITDTFDDKSEPIINPWDFNEKAQEQVEICFVLFSKVIHDRILEKYDCRVIFELNFCNGNVPVYATQIDGVKFAFYLSMLGSGGAGGNVGETSYYIGARKYIMFGSAGSLNEEKTSGKYVIPTESYRDEGLSYHYAPAADYIRIKNADKLAAIFEELQVPYVKGRVWTTASMMRETVNNVAKRKAEGCIAVEMEVAGVQAVCDFYGLELYDFLETGDIVEAGAYDMSGLDSANHDMRKFYIALEIAKRI